MNYGDIDFSVENQARGNKSAVELVKAEQTPTFAKIGENKGLAFTFRKQEVIHFPTADKCLLIPKKFGDATVLYIPGFSEARNRFVSIPLAMFRRIPVLDAERDEFFDPSVRGLNLTLAELSYDVERARLLCETKTIICNDIFPMHRAWLEQNADGKWVRVEGKVKPLDMYEILAFKG